MQHTHIRFAAQNVLRFGTKTWRHQHFDKLFANSLGGYMVDFAIESDDAAKRRSGICLKCFLIGGEGIFA